MSWSINLSGKKNIVQAELEGAFRELGVALGQLSKIQNEEVRVEVSGYASSATDGSCVLTSCNTVQGIAPPAPAQEVDTAAEQPTASEAQTESRPRNHPNHPKENHP